MRFALVLLSLLACTACTSKSSDAKPAGPGVTSGPPGELMRPPSADRLPDDLRPPREESATVR